MSIEKKDAFEQFEGSDYDAAEGGEIYEPTHKERDASLKGLREKKAQDERVERLNLEESPDEDLNEGMRIVQCKDSAFPSPGDQLRRWCELDPLPLTTERDLIREFRESGDLTIRDRLLQHNVRVIVDAAKFCKMKPLDVLSAGLEGLEIALEKYDLAVGGRIADFAFLHVVGKIKEHRRTMIRMVRTPRGKERPIDTSFGESPSEIILGISTPEEQAAREKESLAANKASALARKRFILAAERARPDEVRRQRITDLKEATEVQIWHDTYLTPKQRDIVDLSILTLESLPLERIAQKYHCSVESVRKAEKTLSVALACPLPRTRMTPCLHDDWLVAERGLCVKCLADAQNLVASGATTWAELEERGSAIPISIDDSIQICRPPVCHRIIKARGLCSLHYGRAANLIRTGGTSWEILEQQEKCYPVRQHLDPAVVKQLVRIGTPIKAIARTLHCSPRAVRKCLGGEGGTLD